MTSGRWGAFLLIAIPYFEQPRLTLPGITVRAFGLLVLVAIVVGWWAVPRRARSCGLNHPALERLTVHMLLWGFLGGHVLYWLLVRPATLALRPRLLLNPFEGIYSLGGILSGVLAVAWFARRYQFTAQQLLTYFDAAAYAFPFSWAIARAGCALAHDHIGRPSSWWLAVEFPGGPRLDLGLIEWLFSLAMIGLFLLLNRRLWPAPFFLGIFFLLYGSFRLWLDTLRDRPSTSDRCFGAAAVAFGIAMTALAWRQCRSAKPGDPTDLLRPAE